MSDVGIRLVRIFVILDKSSLKSMEVKTILITGDTDGLNNILRY